MMLRNIVLLILLISSVWTLPLKDDFQDVFQDDFAGNELDEKTVEILVKTGQGLPGMCWVCKWAMGNVKKHISVGATQGSIKALLRQACDDIGFLKFLCKNLLANFMGTLIEELSTTDNAATICSHIGIC